MQKAYSCHFDPSSVWYNGNFGAYGLYSHKENGTAFGFDDLNGEKINMKEIIQVFELDFKDLTAGSFGLLPKDRFFKWNGDKVGKSECGKWHTVEFVATVPSVLYNSSDSSVTKRIDLRYSMLFGIPPSELLAKHDLKPWHELKLQGKGFIRQVAPKITLVFGAILVDTPQGVKLVGEITRTMKLAFDKHIETITQ